MKCDLGVCVYRGGTMAMASQGVIGLFSWLKTFDIKTYIHNMHQIMKVYYLLTDWF